MKIYYAASTKGFYFDAIHKDKIPSDAKQITQVQYDQLLADQSAGKVISPDENGLPITTDNSPTPAQLWSAYQARAKAALITTGVTLERCQEDNILVPPEWVAYRKALRAILSEPSGDPTQPLPAQPAYPAST